MQIRKILARLFFVAGAAAMVVSAFDVPRVEAQTEVDGGLCYDGNRKLCMKKPSEDGGMLYYYWV